MRSGNSETFTRTSLKRSAALDVANQVERLEVDCERCEARDVCNGACPAESLEDNPSPYKPHANSCDHHRAWVRVARYFHDALCAEGNQTFLDHYYPKREDGKHDGAGD